MQCSSSRASAAICVFAATLLASAPATTVLTISPDANPVIEWNQAFIDALIATATPNSSSQRLGAIVHTAIFDAYNGIERRYAHIHVEPRAPRGASRRAAVIAAAYQTLVSLFPGRKAALDERYALSIASLSDDGEDGGESRVRGLSWGEEVAAAVLAWRATDGFSVQYPPFTGGTAIGQWRPIPPATSMSAQALAFTSMFVLEAEDQFRPPAPRLLGSATYDEDLNTVRALGRQGDSSRSPEQSLLAPFWEGNASVHWNQAANQIARANGLSISDSNRLLAVLNVAMADTAITIWSAKRYYGAIPTEVTWRPATAIWLAETGADLTWRPLVPTPSHPEYPAGHPAQNGAAATVLLDYFDDAQLLELTTGATTRTYDSVTQARADGNNARVWGGMHYPSTVTISDATGAAIARYVNRNRMQPVQPPSR